MFGLKNLKIYNFNVYKHFHIVSFIFILKLVYSMGIVNSNNYPFSVFFKGFSFF